MPLKKEEESFTPIDFPSLRGVAPTGSCQWNKELLGLTHVLFYAESVVGIVGRVCRGYGGEGGWGKGGGRCFVLVLHLCLFVRLGKALR